MNRWIKLSVRDRAEAKAIAVALDDRTVRALVVTMGSLLQLPTQAARERVLRYVVSKLEDEEGIKILEVGSI